MGLNDNLLSDLPQAMTQAAFIGATWYIVIELTFRLWVPRMCKKSLYFWSCVAATIGVFTQPLMVILLDYNRINKKAGCILIYFSWALMVIPQSLVLYSRLHLISSNPKYPKYVLWMIATTAVFFGIPTMCFGISAQIIRTPRLLHGYDIWDKIQVTIFFIQETIISILYIIEARSALMNKIILGTDSNSVREVVHHLILVNVVAITLDCILLGLSYSPLFFVQAAYKPCVYAIKLRIEFAILNRLVSVFVSPTSRGSNAEQGEAMGISFKPSWESVQLNEIERVESKSSQMSNKYENTVEATESLSMTRIVRTDEMGVESTQPRGMI